MAAAKDRAIQDHEVVRALGELLSELDLTEIEYENDSLRVRVARQPAVETVAAPVRAVEPPAAAIAAATAAVEDLAAHPGLLTSPMVGVAYTAAEPGKPAFVTLGDTVAVGDTVMLIEAMKVFNPIKAHRAGRISRIFVSNGVPVEYGEPLLLID